MLLQEVKLITGNLQECRLFYAGQLGLEIVDTTPSGISFRVGTCLMHFSEVTGSRPLYHLAFSIPNDLFAEALTWLDTRTTILPYTPESVIADFTNWNAKAFYFRDAGGNILECITHFDHHTYRHGPFSAEHFLSLMEVGLPVDDVTVTCANLHDQYQIPYYRKGPRLRDFSVMGDEEGMLIVTKKGRGWLPTQETAEPFPVSLALKHDHKIINLDFASV